MKLCGSADNANDMKRQRCSAALATSRRRALRGVPMSLVLAHLIAGRDSAFNGHAAGRGRRHRRWQAAVGCLRWREIWPMRAAGAAEI